MSQRNKKNEYVEIYRVLSLEYKKCILMQWSPHGWGGDREQQQPHRNQ